jgi:hypothetical protein
MRQIDSGTLEGSHTPREAARPAKPFGSARVPALSFAAAALFGLLTASSSALAQDSAEGAGRGGLGFGYAQTLRGGGGINLVFDPGSWHADMIVGLNDTEAATQIRFAARGWFHMHSTGSSDFSLGGGLALINNNPDGEPPAANNIFIELGAMLRFFPVSNVSISLFGGLSVGAGDAGGFELNGQPLGALAVTYFF